MSLAKNAWKSKSFPVCPTPSFSKYMYHFSKYAGTNVLLTHYGPNTNISMAQYKKDGSNSIANALELLNSVLH